MDTRLNSTNNLLAHFERQVAGQPAASALIMGDLTYSYAQVNARANQVAAGLRELGVGALPGAETLVGVCMPRSPQAIFAILGILKAGGAYVPIDPVYPAPRQAFMLQDAGTRILLTDTPERAAAFADQVDHLRTFADDAWFCQQSTDNILTPVAADALFHVLYTSGSTGDPKGVCGTHSQMHSRLQWLWHAFPVSADDIFCHKTTLHFVDASLEIFGTLLQGRPLVILPESSATNPELLLHLLAATGVTRIFLVVSHLRALLLTAPQLDRLLPKLNLCVVSGERLTRQLVQEFQQAAPQALLANLYGCTEVPEVSWVNLSPAFAFAEESAPIGYPIPGSELYIVDETLQRVALGVVGELLVGSSLQARGYLNRPAESAARFIANPFGGAHRLYRSGDRVHAAADGLLHYVGRVDHQVKLRGYRVELPEVEAALQADPTVQQSVVVVQEDPTLSENKQLIGFVTPATVDVASLSAQLQARLPTYMLPQRIVALQQLPLTLSGKVDRQALLASIKPINLPVSVPVASSQAILLQLWCGILQREQVAVHDNFFDIGGDSLRLAQLYQKLGEHFGDRAPSITQLLQYPTIAVLANYLDQTAIAPVPPAPRPSLPNNSPRDIAIIGLACRFPGAATPDEFWQNLRNGVDSITDFADTEVEQSEVTLRTDPNYVKAGAILPDIAGFDAELFGYSAREAELLDPQQRLLLECAWEALEQAGYAPDGYLGRVGVYAGSSMSNYFLNHVAEQRPFTEASLQEFQANLANDRNFLSTRISYKLNLRGPGVNVQTACSTGLVAVHMACQGLHMGDCDLALAGSVALRVPQKSGYLYEEGMIRSPDGRCRAFDAQAQGTLFGSGAGMIVLKPLAAAQADGDTILAVIKGSAINNDGAGKVGFTAPSLQGQAAVVGAALQIAEVDPRTITYIEAHGTGTRLGDPVEIAALTQAFAQQHGTYPLPNQYCAIGSVKTNLGHLDEAAGMAGLIKTVLALQHKELPPSLHFTTPNPEIDFAHSPFYVNTSLTSWLANADAQTPRRAGVSSFGMGGTNCHVVLEEAPQGDKETRRQGGRETRPYHILTLSAKNEQALHELVGRYLYFLEEQPTVNLADFCYTANTGRKHFPLRQAVVAASVQELHDQLSALAQRSASRLVQTRPGKLAFLFTGQGSQYVDMGRQLYETQPTLRATLDRCDEILRPLLGESILDVIYDLRFTIYEPSRQRSNLVNQKSEIVNQTCYAQPALFALEYALAELWRSWGIVPDVVMGHSVGEYVAACVAGVFSLADGLKLIVERGRLMQALPPNGAMVAVMLAEKQVQTVIAPYLADIAIAAVNGPENIVISGQRTALQAITAELTTRGIKHRSLAVSHAFHSPLMEPMVAEFRQIARQIHYAPAQIPFVSNVTGQRLPQDYVLAADYWVDHARKPVRYATGIETLREQGCDRFLEIGPKPILTTLGAAQTDGATWLPSLLQDQTDWKVMLESLSTLYGQGVEIDWVKFYQDAPGQRLPLPTYPFQRKRYWISKSELTMNGQVSHQQTTPAMNNTMNGAVRRNTIEQAIKAIVAEALKLEPSALDVAIPLVEIGADSLILVRAVRAIEQRFTVKISMRSFFEELSTISALTAHLEQRLPATWGSDSMGHTMEARPVATEQPAAQPATSLQAGSFVSSTIAGTMSAPTSAEIIPPLVPNASYTHGQTAVPHEVLRFLSQQLDVLRAFVAPVSAPAPDPKQALSSQPQQPTNGSVTLTPPQPARSDTPVSIPVNGQDANGQHTAAPPRRVQNAAGTKLTPQQQQHLDALVARYTQRTAGSKAITQTYRPVHADRRATRAFRPAVKEMVYPIRGVRGQGSRFWDVDGNEYIDLLMGHGVHLFGHNPPFLTQALARQIEQGLGSGIQLPTGGEVARLVAELTGMERVAFYVTGTEAIMTAIRLARAATGRHKIAHFVGAYHGHLDITSGMAEDGLANPNAIAMYPGIAPNGLADALVLDYGNPESLAVIRAYAHELAAVLVEPVQSRNPGLQPKAFVQQLRQVTKELGIPLIFDEIITGFRVHPRGAQAWFDVEADIVTYGKVIGGGQPMSIVAGKAELMDYLDGGPWCYGDASEPQTERIFTGATFAEHPLAMATAYAILHHFKSQGPALQEALNQRMANFAETLNHYFETESVPIRVAWFGSIFRFTFQPMASGNIDLFYFHLVNKGVYISEEQRCWLSVAHTDEDLDYVIQAVKETVAELRDGGFLPSTPRQQTAGATLLQPMGVKEIPEALAVATISNQQRADEIITAPLTDAQTQLWVLHQLGDQAALAYIEFLGLKISGPLHAASLQRAIQQVVDRHEALRTTFSPAGDRQQIQPGLRIDLPTVDFSHLPAAEQDVQIEAWLQRESQSTLNLTDGPLFAVHLLKTSAEAHLLAIKTHHIVVDGWSLGVIFEEIRTLYTAAYTGADCQLSQPMQYREFVAWQKAQRQCQATATHAAYWLAQYQQEIPVLNLPTDRVCTHANHYGGGRQTFWLGAPLVNALRELSKAQGATLFMTMFAAYSTLLYRLAGQTELVVGIPVSGRTPDNSEGMVGYTAHMLPIRNQITAANTFVEHLQYTRGRLLDGYEHEQYPYAWLVEQLNAEREKHQAALVTAVFNLDRPFVPAQIADLKTTLLATPRAAFAFDLMVDAVEIGEEIALDWNYSTDLFDATTICRWFGHFQTLLEAIVAQPNQPISQLPLLTEGEHRQVLVEWNTTSTSSVADYPKEKCIHHLFEEQVARTPDAIAVIHPKPQVQSHTSQAGSQKLHTTTPDLGLLTCDSLTYRELNQRANQLAHHLRAQGVGAETLVGICVERSIEMLVGLLGILKAGGAYVPLDPSYPQERLAFMLQDANVAVLLTQTHLLDSLPSTTAPIICLDRDWAEVRTQSSANPGSPVSADNLAYVIYTSGSTGQPKGVQAPHQAAVNRFAWMWRTMPFAPHEVCCQKTALSFVDSVWEIFGPLLQGIPSIIIPDVVVKDPAAFVETLHDHKVTRLVLVPSLLRTMLAHETQLQERLPRLTHWVCSGEALSSELVQQFYAQLPNARLINLYGSSEVAADATWYDTSVLQGAMSPAYTNIPIGQPIDNIQCYILDSAQQPVPLGVQGELYNRGTGLARGYHQRPDLTNERFIPNPFGPGRLFKTGDLARWAPAPTPESRPTIEFLGRADHQVKLRGFRIELGEIETILRQYPAVQEAIVTFHDDATGEKRLVAYVVSDDKMTRWQDDKVTSTSSVTLSELRDYLQQKLPDYMIPAAFVRLAALPLTPNGKVDRKALPAPGGSAIVKNAEFVPPQTPAEEALADIWAEMLGVTQVGRHDHFFVMGGHSLLATQVMTSVQQRLQTTLPIRAIFDHPTLAGLAQQIAESQLATKLQDYSTESADDEMEFVL